MTNGPILFEADQTDAPDVAAAPVPDLAPQGQAMQIAAQLAARRPSRLTRWLGGIAAALIGAYLSVAAWDFAMVMIVRMPVLGWAITGLLALFVLVLAGIALRELAAIARLGRLDTLRRAAQEAQTLDAARAVVQRLLRFYGGREDLRWARDRFEALQADQLDCDALLGLAETELMVPLDAAALREVESAARQVATVTALVPLALADVVVALTANLRMIRKIAQIYGGRSGFWGGWRLTRAVFAHLVATGAVAVGDDMLDSLLGGSILSKLSRRFGEGLINGALSARVGVAAIEACRPLPFAATARPSVRGVVKRALTGLFGTGKAG